MEAVTGVQTCALPISAFFFPVEKTVPHGFTPPENNREWHHGIYPE
jgi:hypothetical protein